MKLNTLIIDNFLENPDGVRNLLIKNKVPFNIEGHFTGKRTIPVDNIDYRNIIIQKLESVLPFKIKMKPLSFPFQLCLADEETKIHVDPSDWTGVLYLTPNALIGSGTLLFKEDVKLVKKLKEYNENEEENPSISEGKVRADVMSTLGNVYNRLVLFRGKEIPHRSNIPGFGDCLENGRLTQVFFFDEV